MIISYRTALDAASRIARRQGKINREQYRSIQDALADRSADGPCADCEAVSIMAAVDAAKLTADQASNPKAIDWQALMAFIIQIIAIIMQLINPPTPTPSLPAGAGE